jgi:hypothetical protein
VNKAAQENLHFQTHNETSLQNPCREACKGDAIRPDPDTLTPSCDLVEDLEFRHIAARTSALAGITRSLGRDPPIPINSPANKCTEGTKPDATLSCAQHTLGCPLIALVQMNEVPSSLRLVWCLVW